MGFKTLPHTTSVRMTGGATGGATRGATGMGFRVDMQSRR